MRTALHFLQRAENAIITISFIVMVVSAFSQVVNRNFIGAGVSWFEELSRYCMIYMVLLATEMGLRDGSQISVTMFVDRLPPKGRALMKIAARFVVVVFSAVVFYTSLDLLDKQISHGAKSPGLGAPMYIPYFALTLSFALITVVQTISIITRLMMLVRGEVIPEEEGSAS